MIHIVTPDETFRRIAARYYGDWTLWSLIADWNRLDRRKPLISGQAIEIPSPLSAFGEHTVEEGDSYESLSLRYYGSEHFADRIRTANDGKIIYEATGDVFVIPPLGDQGKIVAMGVSYGS